MHWRFLRAAAELWSNTVLLWTKNMERRLTRALERPKVPKVWPDPTWSDSSGFTAGRHTASVTAVRQPRAGCQERITSSSREGLIFFKVLGFCGNTCLTAQGNPPPVFRCPPRVVELKMTPAWKGFGKVSLSGCRLKDFELDYYLKWCFLCFTSIKLVDSFCFSF